MADVCGRRAGARASASKRALRFAAAWTRTRWATGVRIIVAIIIVVLAPVSPGAALPSYPLFYSFQIPLALPGIAFQEDGSRMIYTGALRGTLGGLPVRSARFTYGPRASASVGGGTFTLATAVGDVQGGQILMTSEGERTTLLFFGIYLGSRLELAVTSDRQQIGGSGVTATGLARTGFASHDAYMAAVRKDSEALPSSARDEILAQADTNLRLVGEYQQKPPSP
jgi:hypothetical protein